MLAHVHVQAHLPGVGMAMVVGAVSGGPGVRLPQDPSVCGDQYEPFVPVTALRQAPVLGQELACMHPNDRSVGEHRRSRIGVAVVVEARVLLSRRMDRSAARFPAAVPDHPSHHAVQIRRLHDVHADEHSQVQSRGDRGRAEAARPRSWEACRRPARTTDQLVQVVGDQVETYRANACLARQVQWPSV